MKGLKDKIGNTDLAIAYQGVKNRFVGRATTTYEKVMYRAYSPIMFGIAYFILKADQFMGKEDHERSREILQRPIKPTV